MYSGAVHFGMDDDTKHICGTVIICTLFTHRGMDNYTNHTYKNTLLVYKHK